MADLTDLSHAGLLAEVIGLKHGDHVCVLYDESPDECAETVAIFVATGLSQGEQCIYVWDSAVPARIFEALVGHGIDVEQAIESRALRVLTGRQWQKSDTLNTIEKAAQVGQLIDAAFADGYMGVRFAVEMTWTLRPGIETHDLRDWEMASNNLLGGAPVQALCLYGRERLSPPAIRVGIETHPRLIDTQHSP